MRPEHQAAFAEETVVETRSALVAEAWPRALHATRARCSANVGAASGEAKVTLKGDQDSHCARKLEIEIGSNS
jgi:hypothetical protein